MSFILPSAIRAAGIEPQITTVQILERFQQLITARWGEERAAYVQPLSFAEGVLRVEVRAPAAAQELKVQAAELKNLLNQKIGRRAVRELLVLLVTR